MTAQHAVPQEEQIVILEFVIVRNGVNLYSVFIIFALEVYNGSPELNPMVEIYIDFLPKVLILSKKNEINQQILIHFLQIMLDFAITICMLSVCLSDLWTLNSQ